MSLHSFLPVSPSAQPGHTLYSAKYGRSLGTLDIGLDIFSHFTHQSSFPEHWILHYLLISPHLANAVSLLVIFSTTSQDPLFLI